MKCLLMVLVLSQGCFAQTVFKKSGDNIILTACGTEGDAMSFYRKTGATTSAIKIGSLIRVPGPLSCQEIRYVMPSGRTREYRFFAVPIRAGEFLSESNGVRAVRK